MSDQTSVKPKKRVLMSPGFVQAMLAGHSALGLAFAALIYIVCLTGTVAVFLHELHRWEQPNLPIAGEVSPEAVAAAVNAGHEQAKVDNADGDMFVSGPVITGGRLSVNYHDHETGARGDWVADAQGGLVSRTKSAWVQFMADLHMHLHLPRTWGLYLVGLTGVALLSSLVSGLLSHPRIFKDAFALRWGGSRRLQEADLHNRLGVWGLPFHIVVTLTGALLGLSTLIMGVLALAAYDGDREKAFAELFGPQASHEDDTAAPIPDIAAMIREVQSREPDTIFSSVHIEHAGTAGQIVQLGMHEPGGVAFSTTHHFDGTGKALNPDAGKAGGTGQWILFAIQPLHFGWFGGIAVKLLYGVLGLALTIVTHSGVVIWLARRRDKGRPAPGWEKIWAAVAWSQPLAFGVTAMVGLTSGGDLLLPVYLAVVALSLALAGIASDGVVVSRALRLFGALAIVGAVGVHTHLWSDRITDSMAWYVNLGMLLCAAAISLPMLGALARSARSGRDRRAEEASTQPL
jgi:uncharacterized iron-regulated membrane protein